MDSRKEQLIDYNYFTLWKIKVNTGLGIYIVILYMMSLFPMNKFDILSLRTFTYLMLWFNAIHQYMRPYLTIIEAGKEKWIFEKYRFAPTSAKRLYRVKLERLAKYCAKQMLITLLIQLCGAILFLHQFSLMNLMPITIFFLVFIFETILIFFHAHKAFRKI